MALGGIGIKMGAIRRMGGLISMTRGITLIPLVGCRPVHRRHFVLILIIWRNGYGLVNDGVAWRFYCGSGAMKSSSWEGDYYLLEDGAMAKDQWIGSYYVGSDGRWIPGY